MQKEKENSFCFKINWPSLFPVKYFRLRYKYIQICFDFLLRRETMDRCPTGRVTAKNLIVRYLTIPTLVLLRPEKWDRDRIKTHKRLKSCSNKPFHINVSEGYISSYVDNFPFSYQMI